jgi:hypothetical protein
LVAKEDLREVEATVIEKSGMECDELVKQIVNATVNHPEAVYRHPFREAVIPKEQTAAMRAIEITRK